MATAGRPHPTHPLIALDLLRFACAMLVVAFHLSGFPGQSGSAAVGAGWVGVELFFVLSGAVIAWSAEGSTPGGFARRRALRLLPAAWLCASMTAAVLLIDGAVPVPDTAVRWLTSVAFDPLGTPIDPSYWTLAIEVNFYVAVAVVLRGGGSIQRIERFAVALGCASATYWIAALFIDVPPVQNRLAQLTLLPHGCLFALGVLMRARARGEADAERTGVMALMAGASLAEIVAHAREFPGGAPVLAWAIAIFALGVAAIGSAERWQDGLARHVPARLAARLAAMTYPLYLLHQQIGRIVAGRLFEAGVPAAAVLVVTLALALLLAWLVAHHVEPVLRRGLAAALSRCRGRAPDSPPIASPSAG